MLPICMCVGPMPSSLMTQSSIETLTHLRKPAGAKGRCPFTPEERNTAISVDGEMYVATISDYMRKTPSVSRFLSRNGRVDVSLDNPMKVLQEPTFIKSSAIPGDEKVYFFFSETGNEYNFMSKLTVSRVAQVCKDDVGGEFVLQKRWTTFAKAQLVCQQGEGLPFNILHDIVPVSEGDSSKDITFYGVFRSQWSLTSGVSAVCAFKLQDIKTAFSRSYRKWSGDRYTSQTEKNIQFGKCDLANNTQGLGLVKDTFLAENVQTKDNMVLLSPDQTYSRVVGQQTQAANGQAYTVLFLLSESGYLHKVVLLKGGPHIIEEIQVFRSPQTVKNIILSASIGMVFVGSPEGISQVPVSNCSFHQTCAECVLARDPFCGWDPTNGVCARVSDILSDVRQDVEHGNVTEQCKTTVSEKGPQEIEFYQELNRLTVLLCPTLSSQSLLTWRFSNNTHLPPAIFLQPGDNSLVFAGSPLTVGRYVCMSEERGFEQTLGIFSVKLRISEIKPTSVQVYTTSQSGKHTPTTTAGKTSPTSEQSPGHTTSTRTQTGHTVVTQEPKGYVITTQMENAALNKASEVVSVKSYYGELVAVSILLAICMLMLAGLYMWHLRSLRRATLSFGKEKEPSLGKTDT
ncbi:semaphorin-4B isoform X2 [Sardina pilchardus]|uniref:semaphorin-4B isoform X2 n=1 Tax=Sardina pilchardus TaxID=27697 RepID=UPI002E1612EB